jgi:LmbE family N-acetylglucosaminyl deacetylase
MNVVSIMAHQDDEMRCLGTMLKCRERGDKLAFITLTDGSKGFVQNPGIAREKAARIRQEEMQALAAEIDAVYINIREQDEFLYDTSEVRLKLIEAIRTTRPGIIFTHYSEDYNLDHVTVNRLVRQCAMQACLPVIATQSSPLEEHPAVFLVEPFGPVFFPASHYVDISKYQDAKVALLRHHASQEEPMAMVGGGGLAKITADVGAYRGNQVNCAFAECFVPMQARGAVKPYSVLP